MAVSQEWEVAASATVLASELNALGNGNYSGGSGSGTGVIFDNTPGGVNNYRWGSYELTVTFGSAATANTTVDLYASPALDGTNYMDAPASTNAASDIFIGSFTISAQTAHRRSIGTIQNPVRLPPWNLKFYAKNGAGVAFPATSSTIKLYAYREKAV